MQDEQELSAAGFDVGVDLEAGGEPGDAVGEPRRAVDEQPRGFEVGRRVGEESLDLRVVGERRPELMQPVEKSRQTIESSKHSWAGSERRTVKNWSLEFRIISAVWAESC